MALFGFSQLSARVLVERLGGRRVMMLGIGLSAVSLFWLTRLDATSGYLDVVGPLLLLGAGNGSAFVPLTADALARVEPRHAGSASGLVNAV